jgi:hypothetical protein
MSAAEATREELAALWLSSLKRKLLTGCQGGTKQ